MSAGLLLLVTMSACVGAGSSSSLATGVSAAPTAAAHDSRTAAISGAVVDDSLLPVEGAYVSLLTPNGTSAYFVVQTDVAGKYAFNFLPAGKYKIEVRAPGFEIAVADVEAVAGEVVEKRFRMITGFADVAYYITDHLSKMIGGGTLKYGFECSTTPWAGQVPSGAQSVLGKYCIGGNTCPQQVGCEDVAGGCLGSYSKDTTTPNEYGGEGYPGGYRDLLRNDTWKTQLAEVTWQQSSAVSGRGVLFEVLGPNVTNNAQGEHTNRCGGINQSDPRDFLVLSDTPPMRLEINEAVLAAREIPPQDACCDWRLRLFPGWCDLGNCARWGPDANVLGVVAPTRVEIYYTIFFKEAAPPGWTTLEDS